MSRPAPTNQAEQRRWNDPRWTAIWPDREALTSAVTPHLIETLSPVPGERILDVGCGGGTTTVLCAHAVAPDGVAVGADISVPLTQLARQRATSAGIGGVSFTVADMQTDQLNEVFFDGAASQFGVMFFDEPVTAFTNIRSHLRRGGRFVFVCWQSVEKNPWHIGTALRALMPAPLPPGPGKSVTGPFTLADQGHTDRMLEAAGFSKPRHDTSTLMAEGAASAVVEEAQFALMGIPEAQYGQARHLSAEHLERFRCGPDRFRYPLAFDIVTAVNP